MKTGIIVCAGGAVRKGDKYSSKHAALLNGKRVVDYVIDNILASKAFDDVLVMIRPGEDKDYAKYQAQGVKVAYGDPLDSQNSRRIALNIMKDKYGYFENDLIGIADGNRPFVTPGFYRRLVEVAKEFDNAVPYISNREIAVVYDGMHVLDAGTSRSNVRMTISPCIFKFGLLMRVYEDALLKGVLKESEGVMRLIADWADDDRWIHFVEGDKVFFKVSTKDDLELAKIIVTGMEVRK